MREKQIALSASLLGSPPLRGSDHAGIAPARNDNVLVPFIHLTILTDITA